MVHGVGFEVLELPYHGGEGHGGTSWALDSAWFPDRAASTQIDSESRTLIDVA